MVKRDAARGTWQESHFSWRIRSVLWAGGLYLVTAPLWLLFLVPGWIAWALISLWFLYRIARGWLNLSSNTPMPTFEAGDAYRSELHLLQESSPGRSRARKAYEDDELLAFHDIAPWAPVHVLVIPKEHIAGFYDVTEAHAPMLGRIMSLAPRLMRENGVTNGFRTLVNTGEDGRQEVPHLHVHVMGGPTAVGEGLT